MIGAFHGALVEAWQELRIHKLRVLLSLVGVAIAVCSLTLVVAMSTMAEDAMRVSYEQMSGREATVTLETEAERLHADGPAMAAAVDPVLTEFGVEHATRVAEADTEVVTEGGSEPASATLVDTDYGTIFSTGLIAGRWFSPGDESNLSPSAVVNENVLEAAAVDSSSLPVTLELQADRSAPPTTVTVVGVIPGNEYDWSQVFMLASSSTASVPLSSPPRFAVNAWVPEEIADDLAAQVSSRLTQTTGETWTGYRTDQFLYVAETLTVLSAILLSIAGLILFLGVLGLVNISLVTVHQRVREIGIRRSFGATGSRVFFSVMMESVVATSIAGVFGVAVSVLVLRSPALMEFLTEGMAGEPYFPASAALVGFAVSVGAGAIAGLVPAIIATRAHIVDAIRA